MLNKNLFYSIKKSVRSFPYTEYLFTFMPVYAYMYQKRVIESPFDLLLMIPFILANAAGFIYNTICDADSDSPKKIQYLLGYLLKRKYIKFFT